MASRGNFQFEALNMKEHDGGEVKLVVYETKDCPSAVEARVFLPGLVSQGDSDWSLHEECWTNVRQPGGYSAPKKENCRK